MTSIERLPISIDAVNSYFYPLLPVSIASRLGFHEVAKTQELGPYVAFGAWLREKRIAAKFVSQPLAEVRARKRRLHLINQGKLSHIERGMNGNPDPAFLAQLADLYTLSYQEVVARWMSVRYDVATDVDSDSRITRVRDKGLPTSEGESDVPASERDRELSELRGQVEEYRTLLGQVENAASTLASVIAAGDQIGAVGTPQSKTRRRDRKTG